jgi:hypothetical protein
LNLEAVELLRRGLFGSARSTLKLALTRFQQGLAEKEAETEAEVATTEEEAAVDNRDLMPSKDGFHARIRSREHEESTRGEVIVALVGLGDNFVQSQTLASGGLAANETQGYYYPLCVGMVVLEATTTPTAAMVHGEGGNACEDFILYATLTNTVRATAALCFNLAATFHLEAMMMAASGETTSRGHSPCDTSPDVTSSLLAGALRLYDLILGPTLQLIVSYPSPGQGMTGCGLAPYDTVSIPSTSTETTMDIGASDSSSVRIRSAAWNQKGHAHHLLGQRDSVKACALELESVLSTAASSAPETSDTAREGADDSATAASLAPVLGSRAAAHVVALNVHLHSPVASAMAAQNHSAASSA